MNIQMPIQQAVLQQKIDVRTSITRCFWVTNPQTQTKHLGQTWSIIKGVYNSICTGWNFHWHNTSKKMTIYTENSEPVSQKLYPIAMKHYLWVNNEIERLLTAKVIWGSQSSWSTPIIVMPRWDRGKCLVIDYWALNRVTRKFIWPMPKVEDIFSHLNGEKNSLHWNFEQDTTTFL